MTKELFEEIARGITYTIGTSGIRDVDVVEAIATQFVNEVVTTKDGGCVRTSEFSDAYKSLVLIKERHTSEWITSWVQTLITICFQYLCS